MLMKFHQFNIVDSMASMNYCILYLFKRSTSRYVQLRCYTVWYRPTSIPELIDHCVCTIKSKSLKFYSNETQNIVTTDFNFKKTDILESNETNFLTNVGDTILSDGSKIHYESYFWPQYTVIFPKQVQVGEPFDIVLDYTFVLPSIEYVNNTGIEVWGNNSELQCPTFKCERYKINLIVPLNVDLLNKSNYIFKKNIPNEQYVENISRNHGYVHRPYNNTYPQQENFTFIINTPTINFNYGTISVGYMVDYHGRSNIHFYIAMDQNMFYVQFTSFF